MSRGHSIYHFATRADYEPVFADVAAQMPVKYAVDEWRLEPDHRVYASPLEAPDFDLSKWGRSPGTMFFVLPLDAELPFSHRPQRQVPEKYGFDLSLIGEPPNYRWIDFHPCSFHKSEQFGEGLLQGWLATNSGHPDSQTIFNAFKKSIKKRFEYFRLSGVYVGPEAVKYFESGGRLTEDLRRPREGDSKRIAPTPLNSGTVGPP
jgi:hypothetical protein